MLRRSIKLGLAIGAVLASAGLVRAEEGELSLRNPVYAANQAAKPLMAALDKAGVGNTMESDGFNAGGFVEGSWTYNFNSPDNQTNVGRVFDFEDQDPTLNQIQVFLEKTVDATKGKFDWGGRIEAMWGGDARLIHSSRLGDHHGFPSYPGSPATGDGPDEQFDLTQAYMQFALPVGNGLTITAGKFVTLLGYEYINPTQNPLFSHSYMFGFAIPFTNTGITGKYNINDKMSMTLGITRGWEQTLEDNNDAIDVIGQFAYNVSDKLNFAVTGISGPEQHNDTSHYRTVLDLVATYKLGDNLTIGLNADYGYEAEAAISGGDAHWDGVAGYLAMTIDPHMTLNGRIEYFNDHDGARGLASTVYEATIGVSIKPWPDNQWAGGLVIRPELRWDHSNDHIFNDGNDDNQYTAGGDIIWAF